jgi:hypothetical protein
MHEVSNIPVDQGEVNIRKISAIPKNVETRPVERSAKGFIISHSKSGHHHLLVDGKVMERINAVPAGMKILYAVVEEPTSFIHDAPEPHEGYILPAGIYEFRIAREYDPFSAKSRPIVD